ncbi:MAG TPA: PilZ domain-containing protein [Terriglobales bacterium]|nr:PilZ domain-containing protein [Terriglobales bacterium]
MALECLVVVREPKLQRALSGLLTGLGVHTRMVPDPEQATKAISESRLDAVIVDCCDFADGPKFIRSMRKLPANAHSITFAILPPSATSKARTETEAHFILQQPLSLDLITRSLRAARNLMLQEKRRFFRYPVNLPVSLVSAGEELKARCTNVSAGGMALASHPVLESTWAGRLKFELPEKGGVIEAKAEVAWMLPDKTAGLRFTTIADNVRTVLEQWISARVVDEEPSGIVRQG